MGNTGSIKSSHNFPSLSELLRGSAVCVVCLDGFYIVVLVVVDPMLIKLLFDVKKF